MKRPPSGCDADHPFIEDIKRKDFTIGSSVDEAAACKPDFISSFVRFCKDGAPFMRFMATAVGLPFDA